MDAVRDEAFQNMVNGATNALKVVLDLKEGENILVINDSLKLDIGQAFEKGAMKLGANVDLYSLPENSRPLTDIPNGLSETFDKYHVFINAFESFPDETPFRIKLAYRELENGARVGHAPGITKDMMTEGAMNADYEQIAKEAEALIKALEGAVEAHLTTPAGTDIVLNIEDRLFETDVKIKGGNIGNLPAGEIWCGPVENRGDGIIVVDGSIGDVGILCQYLTITVEKGRVTKLECDDKAGLEEVERLLSVDFMAKVIGELGIGLNPKARLTGNLLEDEKAGGTAHIAFGNNIDMTNGRNNSKTHRDFLFYKPTITVTYKDGSERTILKDGIVSI